MDAGAGKQLILTRFRHLTMEDNLRFDAELPGVGAQIRVPPAGADDVEAGVGTRGKIIKNVLDALVRNNPRQSDQTIRMIVRYPRKVSESILPGRLLNT